MNLNIIRTNKFKNDVEVAVRRGHDPDLLELVITNLVTKKRLEPRYKDHKLTGNWVGSRECHIKPDWLLIYRIDGNTLILERTGSHSDLF